MKIKPRPVIAITPTTRVRHFALGASRSVAVWRAFKLIATIVCALMLMGCADRYHTFTIGGPDAPAFRAELTDAIAMWERADSSRAIGIVEGERGDVSVEIVQGLKDTTCAQMTLWPDTPKLQINPNMSTYCLEHLPIVFAHELGHYMAQSNAHLPAGHLMAADAQQTTSTPTPADVAYAEGEP